MTRLEVRGLVKEYRLRDGFRSTRLRAVDDVGFTLDHGRTVALVGQSGSGKSTIAKLLLQLERPTAGEILLDGRPVARRGSGLIRYRRLVQMVFQDPFASLNPHHDVAHHLTRPLRLHHPALTRADIDIRVRRLLERVQLDPGLAGRRGRIVEHGPADEVILNPRHEYTRLLADATPNPERRLGTGFKTPG